MKKNRRRSADKAANIIISMISMVGLLILVTIFVFIFQRGTGLLSWKLFSGNYYPETYDTYFSGPIDTIGYARPADLDPQAFYSEKWGIALIDDLNFEGKHYVRIEYVDPETPLTLLPDKNKDNSYSSIASGQSLDKVIFTDNSIFLSKQGAKAGIELFDNSDGIRDMLTTTPGNGIRGSIITTGYLILMTLAIALPLGIFSAVYLHEFAPKDKWYVNLIRRFIEILTGVPSIVFGLLGAAVFIPFTSSLFGASGGNLISGALTLAVIVLPVIISATEDALKNVPDDYRQASLALGANKTQTTFRVVIKSAVPGILSATLLSVGRIIGESAALIYAIGTAIKDQIILTEKSTSLAVFIWSIMAGETPNFDLACAVSIIIMAIVLILNFSIKLIARRISSVRT